MTTAIISHPDCLLHDMGDYHPECPDRVRVIQQELVKLKSNNLRDYLAPLATKEQLIRAHDQRYIDWIFEHAPSVGVLALDADTSMNPFTLQAALRAAGAAILAVDLVMAGEVKNVFCNVRPPGHHAEKSRAMGFCFFNNIAIGALHALEEYQLKRVAIIDFDVHHGNGTENIFQNDERVLYCSSFQSPFYPFSGERTESSHIINTPLPDGATGNLFREQVEKYWLNKIVEFKPEIIFFSAGFDAYYNDDMSGLLFNEEDYVWITQKMKEIAEQLCNGRLISMLEGGYDLNGLGLCVAMHVMALADS
jgi:acetoin utilization deacetylase AcuC-like enzyme